MSPMTRSLVCSGTAIMLRTDCCTMLICALSAMSICASRTSSDDFSLITRSRTVLEILKPAQRAAPRQHRFHREVHDDFEQLIERPVPGQLAPGADQRPHLRIPADDGSLV